tara:strand:+ start:1201 stop:2418 length:1218 start_codon:yes stop_codon:yes gene_type:complete
MVVFILMHSQTKDEVLEELAKNQRLLLIQDIDGVCIPLVKDPLTRKVDASYILDAAKLKKEFFVLTNGEHEGRRGVNRLIEKALGKDYVKKEGLYLPGLAAGGIEFQDRYGNTSYQAVNQKEIEFLAKIPKNMKKLLREGVINILGEVSSSELDKIIETSVLDTKFSPTINLNALFDMTENSVNKQIELQIMLGNIMKTIIDKAREIGLTKSFYLHIAPNLGKEGDNDIIKYSREEDIGTTDIQLMLKGAIKERGLIVLINKYIEQYRGSAPLGKNFNVRDCPSSTKSLVNLCLENFPAKEMPLLVGVGDTVTSSKSIKNDDYERGGSDRGFLTLIQELGKAYKKENKVIIVDSSWGEVERPSFNKDLKGITDPDDPLKFNLLIKGGPKEYNAFFSDLANLRSLN